MSLHMEVTCGYVGLLERDDQHAAEFPQSHLLAGLFFAQTHCAFEERKMVRRNLHGAIKFLCDRERDVDPLLVQPIPGRFQELVNGDLCCYELILRRFSAALSTNSATGAPSARTSLVVIVLPLTMVLSALDC